MCSSSSSISLTLSVRRFSGDSIYKSERARAPHSTPHRTPSHLYYSYSYSPLLHTRAGDRRQRRRCCCCCCCCIVERRKEGRCPPYSLDLVCIRVCSISGLLPPRCIKSPGRITKAQAERTKTTECVCVCV